MLLALGGNVILPGGTAGTIDEQREITLETMTAVVDALETDDRMVLTHGNGPVVGNILIRNAAAAERIPPMPLDICDADSQGGIGYMIVQCLENALAEANVKRNVTAVVTRVRVRLDDPAFDKPTKPIGPFYSEAEADRLSKERGWIVQEDAGRGWRRRVPSPLPREVLELEGIRTLFNAGHIVVAAGGGGIPVVVGKDGKERGVEAVVDKDRASALIASALDIDRLIIVTGVSHVAIGFGTANQKDLSQMTVDEAMDYMSAEEFGVGSMRPKIDSAIAFLRSGGREVLVTSPDHLAMALRGESGTRIVP